MEKLEEIKKKISPELADELQIFFANTNLDNKEKNYLIDLILKVYKIKFVKVSS